MQRGTCSRTAALHSRLLVGGEPSLSFRTGPVTLPACLACAWMPACVALLLAALIGVGAARTEPRRAYGTPRATLPTVVPGHELPAVVATVLLPVRPTGNPAAEGCALQPFALLAQGAAGVNTDDVLPDHALGLPCMLIAAPPLFARLQVLPTRHLTLRHGPLVPLLPPPW